ncbi:unnamed protein product [Vicia faba]|uniref:Uncharacterized protein n=1 Tax=Vicia faba TaxID=3906 RepID=A0AAV0YL20_VICFA|nr:unnamed protein product [Vicia faba]
MSPVYTQFPPSNQSTFNLYLPFKIINSPKTFSTVGTDECLNSLSNFRFRQNQPSTVPLTSTVCTPFSILQHCFIPSISEADQPDILQHQLAAAFNNITQHQLIGDSYSIVSSYPMHRALHDTLSFIRYLELT